MNRDEIVHYIGYQMPRAALEYIEKHEFADAKDAFEAGAEWMQKKIIEKACEWLLYADYDSLRYRDYYDEFSEELFVDDFRKSMGG